MEQSDFEVRDIATYEPETVPLISTVRQVRNLMQNKEYSVVMVADADGQVTGYVRDSMLESLNNSLKVKNKYEEISVDNIIHPSTEFEKTVAMLSDNFFYFIGDCEDVYAIVTRADLNTKPVRNYLFRELLDFEKILDEYIHENILGWEDFVDNSLTINEIENRYTRAKKKNIQLKKVNYANFSTKMNIIYEHDDTREIIGYENTAKNDINEISSLRNDVAHGHPVIHSMSDKLDIEKRNVGDLEMLFKEMNNIERSLKAEL